MSHCPKLDHMALFRPTTHNKNRRTTIVSINWFTCWGRDVTNLPWSIKSHGGVWVLAQNCSFVYKKENGFWVDNKRGGHLHKIQMSYKTHPRASSQTLSPILWSYSFSVHDNLTKPFVTVHQLPSLFPGKGKDVIQFYLLGEFSTFTSVGHSGTQQSIWGCCQLIMQSYL